MPKPVRTARPDLYQVVVTRAGRGEIRFGPRMEQQFATAFCDVILGAIVSGREKELSDPHIVKCV